MGRIKKNVFRDLIPTYIRASIYVHVHRTSYIPTITPVANRFPFLCHQNPSMWSLFNAAKRRVYPHPMPLKIVLPNNHRICSIKCKSLAEQTRGRGGGVLGWPNTYNDSPISVHVIIILYNITYQLVPTFLSKPFI